MRERRALLRQLRAGACPTLPEKKPQLLCHLYAFHSKQMAGFEQVFPMVAFGKSTDWFPFVVSVFKDVVLVLTEFREMRKIFTEG